ALVNGAAPGTHVLLRRGDVWNGAAQLRISTASGTEAAPIVLGAYGGGERPRIVSTSTTSAVQIRSSAVGPSQHFWLHEIDVRRLTQVQDQVGVSINEGFHPELPRDITLSGVTVANHGAGMTIYGPRTRVHGCRIADNTAGNGIYASAPGIEFRYNEIENNGAPPPDAFTHSVYLARCDGLTFEFNTVRNATDGVKSRRTDNGVFRGNTIHGIEAIGIHLGGDSAGGSTNNRIESNLFFDNAADIVIKSESGVQVALTDGLVIANNIVNGSGTGFLQNGFRFLVTDVPCRSVWIVNNIFYDVLDGGVRVSANGVDLLCSNNVFGKFNSGDVVSLSGSVTSSANLDYRGHAEFADLFLVDPAGGDFRPTAQSAPLIDQAMNASSVISVDFAGNARPFGPQFDIGPFEFGYP
ncbi:MAG: hypothetical protein ACI80K_003577, partial [Paracoccaceae bacterium]